MSKNMTKLCPSCDFFKVSDEYSYLCKWGKSKKRKILLSDRVRETCKLIKKAEK